jgi:hypothetical protein
MRIRIWIRILIRNPESEAQVGTVPELEQLDQLMRQLIWLGQGTGRYWTWARTCLPASCCDSWYCNNTLPFIYCTWARTGSLAAVATANIARTPSGIYWTWARTSSPDVSTADIARTPSGIYCTWARTSSPAVATADIARTRALVCTVPEQEPVRQLLLQLILQRWGY